MTRPEAYPAFLYINYTGEKTVWKPYIFRFMPEKTVIKRQLDLSCYKSERFSLTGCGGCCQNIVRKQQKDNALKEYQAGTEQKWIERIISGKTWASAIP